MKKAIVLGGSSLQFDLVIAVRRLGFEVLLCDINPDCYCRPFADRFFEVSIGDHDAVLKIAHQENPTIVHTIATEAGNLTACYVSEQLGLRSNPYRVAKATTDKGLMKEVMAAAEISTGRVYGMLSHLSELEDVHVGYPVIVKPVDGSAGRGVVKVSLPSELTVAVKRAFSFSPSNRVLLEEYIEGEQFSVETISCDGKHQVVAVTEEHFSGFPNNIETQQCVPARLDKESLEKIHTTTINTLNAFDIVYGACHLELRLTPAGEVRIIEIASRMGGWRSELIQLALGIDFAQMLVLSLLGRSYKVHPSKPGFAIGKMLIKQRDLEKKAELTAAYPENLLFEYYFPGKKDFVGESLADSIGYYFLSTEQEEQVDIFLER